MYISLRVFSYTLFGTYGVSYVKGFRIIFPYIMELCFEIFTDASMAGIDSIILGLLIIHT